jgi:hypothetical protein
MIALGTGAQTAIEQQVRAAGMNLIVVKAGNYKTKTEDDVGGVVDHQAAVDTAVAGVARFVPSGRRSDGEARPPDVARSGSATSRPGSAPRRR